MPAESSRFSPVKPHLRRAHPRVRPVVERANQRLQPPWVRHRVVVQRGQIPRARCQQPLVDRRPEPTLRLFSMTRISGGAAWRPGTSWSRTKPAPAVIHHDHVKVAPRLFRERFQAFQQSRSAASVGTTTVATSSGNAPFYQPHAYW